MDISLYFAQVFGLFFFISGVAILINRKEYKKIFSKFIKTKSSIIFLSMFILLLGLFIVLKHNIWEFSWVGLVTFLGWAILVKGAVIMLFPNLLDVFEKKFSKYSWYFLGGVMYVLIGLYLTYVGFFI
ncbi:MAG: hypothetical protein L3J07_02635 [Candidatus Magasanikbacteria bacterium]|nr:hypothetical protein [Candidatus Magasanikbacteria bacterium]